MNIGFVMAYFRFHGWRNRYWREDYYIDICPHDGEVYVDELFTMCVLCGAVFPPIR